MHVPNTKRHLIKIRTFLQKSILIWINITSQDVLKGLYSTKFPEICTAIKHLTNVRTTNLIAFKHPNFVREPF